ncbi:hypothetical protein [Vibrio sp. MA40-2]|uniref:hypothetical protein n=1 Tax=Vibrio sp. MA40-2 TaxID=3391828 RepID=UPI0039A6F6B1
MNKFNKIASILAVAALVGCATPGQVDMPYVKAHDVQAMNEKKIAYELTYQAPEYGVFFDGEMLPSMPISEARLNGSTRTVVNNFNQILASQLPSNALIVNSDQGDYKVVAHIKAFDGEGPVTIHDLFGETLLKETLTLGFASNEQEIVADFEITYTVVDSQGSELLSKTYKVNDSIEHEKSDYEIANINGLRLTGELFKKHVTLTLNEFVEEISNLK